MLATVYTRDERRILREKVIFTSACGGGEIEEERARLHEELARKDTELERLRRLLDDGNTR